MPKASPDVSVLILTRDEEANLPVTLASLAPLGAQVFVVDSGSTDRTCEIARAAGAAVYRRTFTTHAEQVNWALRELPLRTEWIMRLDADERLTPELVDELSTTLPSAPPTITGFELKRRVYFWGRWIKHGGYYPTWLFRIWRRGTAVSEQRAMDEHMVSRGGKLARLSHDIIDENHKGLSFWIDKHNRYADREVQDMLRQSRDAAVVQGQAARRRWLKANLYQRSPRFIRSFAYWSLRYVVLRGFMDGTPGLVFHFLQGCWYRFLVDAKLEELHRSGSGRAPRGASER